MEGILDMHFIFFEAIVGVNHSDQDSAVFIIDSESFSEFFKFRVSDKFEQGPDEGIFKKFSRDFSKSE